MVEVSYLAAFLGGVLSLLSPCSALLLPAFFAYAFQSRKELVKRTAVFYLGLCATLVPLGMGISAVSRLFYGQRGTLILVAGGVIILLGVIQILGGGFELGPVSRLRNRFRGASGSSSAGASRTGGTFALGAVYGFAGFCAGPILGAVLMVPAASGGGVVEGASLLAAYALGMAAPLFLLAALWDRLNLGRRSLLRGRELALGPLRLHTTNLISGTLFVLLGAAFIAYEGTSALSAVYEAYGAVDLAYDAERWASAFARSVPDALVLAVMVLAVALSVAGAIYGRRRRKEQSGKEPEKGRQPEKTSR